MKVILKTLVIVINLFVYQSSMATNYYVNAEKGNDSNNGTEDTSPTFKAFEEGSETMSKEANVQLAIRQEKFIRDLKNALLRIENKTYGVCRVTGNLIQKERLKLVPHATLSIEAKKQQY